MNNNPRCFSLSCCRKKTLYSMAWLQKSLSCRTISIAELRLGRLMHFDRRVTLNRTFRCSRSFLSLSYVMRSVERTVNRNVVDAGRALNADQLSWLQLHRNAWQQSACQDKKGDKKKDINNRIPTQSERSKVKRKKRRKSMEIGQEVLHSQERKTIRWSIVLGETGKHKLIFVKPISWLIVAKAVKLGWRRIR